MFLTVFFVFILNEQFLELDEIYLRKPGFSAVNEDKVFLTWPKGMSQQLAIFSFNDGLLKIIEDGRIKMASPFVISSEKGFFLIDKLGKGSIVLVDLEGKYNSTSNLHRFENWESSFQLTFLTSVKKDQAIVTFKHQEQNLLFLGRLHFKEMSLDILFQSKVEDDFIKYWVPYGDNFILANRETGQIDLYDSKSFRKIRQVRKPDPLQLVDAKKYKYLSRHSKYWAVLSRPIPLENQVYFRWNKVFNEYGVPYKSPVIKTLMLSKDGALSESDLVTLGSFGEEKLVYHWMDMEIQLLER